MKIGFLFSGQGTQTVGMGKDLYNKYEEVRNVYENVKKLTGIDIAKISFEGPDEELNKTEITQLAIVSECLAIVEILKEYKIEAIATCGLSLGEYTGLIEDDVINFENGIKLVQKRGEIMQKYTPTGNWKMAAILGLTDEQVINICKEESEGFVKPANFNTIGQIVISGEENAVNKVAKYAKEIGAKKVAVLNTAGPFHTIKLKECSKILKKELEKIKINNKNSKVIKNIDGLQYKENDDVAEILSNHIMNPVKFSDCLKTMYEKGVDTFIEIGPGKTLSSFVKRMKFDKDIKLFNINNVETLNNVIKEIGKYE